MHDLVVVHGGVDMPPTDAALESLDRAARSAWALRPDAIAAAVSAMDVLEDDPAFNAGFGSVLNEIGEVEVDAAVVDGRSGRIGAVGAVLGLRHPTRVAAAVMHEGPAVLLSGAGARRVADDLGLPHEDLRTTEQIEIWRAIRSGAPLSRYTGASAAPNTETVGAIAVISDAIAAATSTGGVSGKPPGRIGDSAILGAGHWADSRVAVLCSGEGESIIRFQLAYRVAERISSGHDIDESVDWGVRSIAQELRSTCAVLALDATSGRVSAAHSGFAFPVVLFDGSSTEVVPPQSIRVVP